MSHVTRMVGCWMQFFHKSYTYKVRIGNYLNVFLIKWVPLKTSGVAGCSKKHRYMKRHCLSESADSPPFYRLRQMQVCCKFWASSSSFQTLFIFPSRPAHTGTSSIYKVNENRFKLQQASNKELALWLVNILL